MLSIFMFGFVMSLGWYTGKVLLLVVNEILDRVLYRIDHKKVNEYMMKK